MNEQKSRVVIVGANCRFPGQSNSPDQFFDNIMDGSNFCSEVPENRFSLEKFSNTIEKSGKTYVRRAHFIDYDYRQFDTSAFGFAPAEAEVIDPQQRLLLETAWGAIESGLGDIDALRGSETGVFVGGFTLDHMLNSLGSGGRSMIGSHSAAGATLTMLANRISYAFDLRGPSYAVDTACSSSLVAFEAAVRSIESGRCTAALAGGVNFMIRPEYFIAMSHGRFLARDGRSKSFDARADGYGRGEGAGIVVLKSREQALIDGDNIIAEVAAAGVGQDGRTSSITVPNRDAQESLMRRVLAESGLDASDISYVEAHGTGTPVGDPLEVSAIGAVYGASDRDAPCVIGSVKSNIGHLEAAAGVAGVIKAAWMLERGCIPPISGLGEPNPALPLDQYNVRLADQKMDLPGEKGSRSVAINSFGYGGTNAHVVLRDPEPIQASQVTFSSKRLTSVLPVSAKSSDALNNSVAALGEAFSVETAEAKHEDMSFTLARRRTHYVQRAAAFGSTACQLGAALNKDSNVEQLVSGQAPAGQEPKVAFVYTGMGPQWWGMGRDLYEKSEIFAQALREADEVFIAQAGFSILAEMLKSEAESQIKKTEFAQPANFMIQMGLTKLLAAEGVVADGVVGHSVGEVSSGWASGMLSLEQALKVSFNRSKVQAQAAGLGAMLAAAISEKQAEQLIAKYEGLDIAAINGPSLLTLSGNHLEIEKATEELVEQGIFARKLDVEIPYHSAFMEPLKPALIESLAGMDLAEAELPLYSTVSGDLDGREFDGEYWADNVRLPVRFSAAIEAMLLDGYTHFVEVGPHPVLSRAMVDVFEQQSANVTLVSTLLMTESDEVLRIARTVAELYVSGATVDWQARHPSGNPASLPHYGFAREELWCEANMQLKDRIRNSDQPLAQEQRDNQTVVSDLGTERLNYLHDHVVAGTAIMPAAGYLDAFLSSSELMADADSKRAAIVLSELDIARPLLLSNDSECHLEHQGDAIQGVLKLVSRNLTDPENTQTHASVRINRLPVRAMDRIDPASLWSQVDEGDSPDQLYRSFAAMGLEYGPAFQSIERLGKSADGTAAVVTLTLPEAAGELKGYLAHPTLLDGSFQAALTLLGDDAYLPTSIRAFELFQALPARVHARISLVAQSSEEVVCDIVYVSEFGEVVARLHQLTCSAMERQDVALREYGSDFQYEWDPLEAIELTNSEFLLLHMPGDAMVDALTASGQPVNCLDLSSPQIKSNIIESLVGIAAPSIVLSFGESETLHQSPEQQINILAQLQQVLKGFDELGKDAPVISLVTRCAQPVLSTDSPDAMQAAMAGFARVVFNESEDLPLNIVDFDPQMIVRAASEPNLAKVIAAELSATTDTVERAMRGTVRFAPVLREQESFDLIRTESLLAGWDATLRLERTGPVLLGDKLNTASAQVDAWALLPDRDGGISTRAGVAVVDAEGQSHFGLTSLQTAPQSTLEETAGLIPKPAHLSQLQASALGPIVLPVTRLIRALGNSMPRRAAVCNSAHGIVLGQLLEQQGVEVVMLTDESNWTQVFSEIMRAEQGPFDLLAVPLARFTAVTPSDLWLTESASIIDLALDGTHAAEMPKRATRFVSLASTLPTVGEAGLRASLADLAQDQRLAELELHELRLPVNDWQGSLKSVSVVSIDRDQALTAHLPNVPTFSRDGSYIVTGGFGGLGGETAKWLAQHGAGRIVLAGRGGADSRGAAELMAQVEALGATAVALKLDLGNSAAAEPVLAEMIADCDRVASPLRGVFHAAGVTRDASYEEMDAEAFAAVMAPKAHGAEILDRVTESCTLDHFVMYSSIAALVGNIGQSNYVAANCWLDALAVARQRRGKPGLAVRFGAIADAGMATDPALAARLKEIGLTVIPARDALASMGHAMQLGLATALASSEPDWKRFGSYDRRGAATPRLAETCGVHLKSIGSDLRLESLWRELAAAPYRDRLAALAYLLRDVVAKVMRLDPEMIPLETGLHQVGLDSLLSVTVQVAIQEQLGCSVSAMLLISGQPTLDIAAKVLEDRGLGEAAESKAA